MAIQVGARPAQLDGCWKTWNEVDVDNVIRTEFESGNVRTRRRFTGRQRMVEASVTLPMALYQIFDTWFQTNQKQGAIATLVKTPYGTEEPFQWQPPKYQFDVNGTFTAAVTMFQGDDF